jgi:putative ABC transport system permease protein
MSYTVSRRTRELGLRMALGADASSVMRLVMSHGQMLTAGGVVIGLAVALGTTQLMGNLLYQGEPARSTDDRLACGVTAVALLL